MTEEVLDIVWTSDDGQDFRKGVYAYGLFLDPDHAGPSFPDHLWPSGTAFHSWRLCDDAWVVLRWSILVVTWPSAGRWREVIEGTLTPLIKDGAQIAWCGLEGSFEVPPLLFDPVETSDGIYAMATAGRFSCSAELGKPYRSLSRFELAEFERLSRRH